MLVIQKVSSNFALVEGGEYNLGHWRKVKPITHVGIKERNFIAFFSITGGAVEDGFSTKSGWKYYAVSDATQGIRVLPLSSRVNWEAIDWPEESEKELTRIVPSLPSDPNRERKREISDRYRWW